MKNFKSLLAILLLLPLTSMAQSVCGRSRMDMSHFLSDPSSRIAFSNRGGIFGQGVCWWHSRLQRSSAFLVEYAPSAPKPTSGEVRRILISLRDMDRVVVIPGYSDFYSFTKDNQNEVQSMLNGWQRLDGIFRFVWTRSITGSSWMTETRMRQQMDEVFVYFKDSPLPIWLMAQIKGITAHALLVMNMVEVDSGYDLEVIDSNHPNQTLAVHYRFGDHDLRTVGLDYGYVPYVGFQKDFRKISIALQRNCGGSSFTQDMMNVKKGRIEK